MSKVTTKKAKTVDAMATVYIMTNDLRLHDNKAFDYFMSLQGNKSIAFVFDPAFQGSERHNARANAVFRNAVKQLTSLLTDNGIVVATHKTYDFVKVHNVIISEDTTPFARQRLAVIESLAVSVKTFDTKHFLRESSKEYKVFSAYYNDVLPQLMTKEYIEYMALVAADKVPKDMRAPTMFKMLKAPNQLIKQKIKLYDDAMKLLAGFDPDKYARTEKASLTVRSGATNVSWALARGIVSAREVYEHCRKECAGHRSLLPSMISMARELIFRDFYSRVTLWYLPDYNTRFRNKKQKWKITDYHKYIAMIPHSPEPIKIIYKTLIDTGRISNYGRMLFATWTYDIGADWQLGELLFAINLLDYDFCSNHWNWAHHSVQGLNYQWPGHKFKVENVTLYM